MTLIRFMSQDLRNLLELCVSLEDAWVSGQNGVQSLEVGGCRAVKRHHSFKSSPNGRLRSD
jgi:hypothetical protein